DKELNERKIGQSVRATYETQVPAHEMQVRCIFEREHLEEIWKMEGELRATYEMLVAIREAQLKRSSQTENWEKLYSRALGTVFRRFPPAVQLQRRPSYASLHNC
ncbi:hypothetical protein HAX54_025766, partial [Datura stramonium]|nr:hypothetical protein [Datura stramonium]